MVCTQKGEMRLQRSTGGNKIKNEKEVYEDRRCERKADVDAKGIAMLKGAS